MLSVVDKPNPEILCGGDDILIGSAKVTVTPKWSLLAFERAKYCPKRIVFHKTFELGRFVAVLPFNKNKIRTIQLVCLKVH